MSVMRGIAYADPLRCPICQLIGDPSGFDVRAVEKVLSRSPPSLILRSPPVPPISAAPDPRRCGWL